MVHGLRTRAGINLSPGVSRSGRRLGVLLCQHAVEQIGNVRGGGRTVTPSGRRAGLGGALARRLIGFLAQALQMPCQQRNQQLAQGRSITGAFLLKRLDFAEAFIWQGFRAMDFAIGSDKRIEDRDRQPRRLGIPIGFREKTDPPRDAGNLP